MGQYIGARYVPRFMDVYDATQIYEALDVVDNGLGTSYIAKIPVPAGTPLTNTTYWAIYGASSGAIINLQNQIDVINGDIVNIQTDLAAINSPTMRNMASRKFVFIGDSYTQVPTPGTSFVAGVASRLGLSASQYHNIGVSGDSLPNFLAQVSGYSFGDEDEVTDVIIAAGMNDCQAAFASSTLGTYIPQLITAVKNKFPNCIIWAGFCANGYYEYLSGSYPTYNYDNVHNIKYLWRKHFSASPYVIYMDKLDYWYRMLMDTDFFHGGSMHPYGNGIDTLAEMIANYLKGGSSNIGETTTFNTYADTQLSFNNWNGIRQMPVVRSGDTEIVKLYAAGLGLTSNITISNGSDIELVRQAIDPNTENTTVYASKPAVVAATLGYTTSDAPSTIKLLPASFRFDGGSIWINTKSVLTPITNVNSLWWEDMEFIFPADAI